MCLRNFCGTARGFSGGGAGRRGVTASGRLSGRRDIEELARNLSREHFGQQTVLSAKSGGEVPTTRQWLREVRIGPLKLTPEGSVYRLEGELAMGALLSGIAGLPTVVASPSIPSWNQMHAFLQEMRRLRESGISAT